MSQEPDQTLWSQLERVSGKNSTETLMSLGSALYATGTVCKMKSMSSKIAQVLTWQTCGSCTTISSAAHLAAQAG